MDKCCTAAFGMPEYRCLRRSSGPTGRCERSEPRLSPPGHLRHSAQDQGRGRVGQRLRPSAEAGAPGARTAPASARKEDLFAACARGRVHRQGQGSSALRVRRQGLDRHDAAPLQGRTFIAHAKALPGNPYDGHTLATMIPEIETQIGANLTRIVADRLSRPQCPARAQVQGPHLRPETTGHRDQTPTPPSLGGRTGHWPRQDRPPHRPQPSRRNPRRRRQRRTGRRRLQLQEPFANSRTSSKPMSSSRQRPGAIWLHAAGR